MQARRSPFAAAWRRGLLTGVITAACLALVFGGGYLDRDRTPTATPAPSPSAKPSQTARPSAGTGAARLVEVPGGTVAVSATAGPRRLVAGRASGFGHDAPGAALAATSLAVQASAAA